MSTSPTETGFLSLRNRGIYHHFSFGTLLHSNILVHQIQVSEKNYFISFSVDDLHPWHLTSIYRVPLTSSQPSQGPTLSLTTECLLIVVLTTYRGFWVDSDLQPLRVTVARRTNSLKEIEVYGLFVCVHTSYIMSCTVMRVIPTVYNTDFYVSLFRP